jgi:two-component system, NarL family, sensor histidine kinase DegS
MSSPGRDLSGSAYTPPTMETGIRGDRRADVDALYTEAQQALTQSANRLRALTERLRQLHADEVATAVLTDQARADGLREAGRDQQALDTARAGQLLSRLELITRDLEDGWRFLERGQQGEWTSSGRGSVDEAQIERPANLVEARLVLEAQEQERTRLAEELHDGPAQTLSNAVFRVRIVERAMRSDPALANSELADLGSVLERETERLRDFIRQLRPSLQESGDLGSVLTDAAKQMAEETGIEVAVDLTAPEDVLDVPARTAVLRVALEALRNVRKHSGAERVRLNTRLEAADPPDHDWWILEIQDDGRGFSQDEVALQAGRRHFGLRFMRERAQLVGGWLEIVSEAAAGTTVRLKLDPRERSRTSW